MKGSYGTWETMMEFLRVHQNEIEHTMMVLKMKDGTVVTGDTMKDKFERVALLEMAKLKHAFSEEGEK